MKIEEIPSLEPENKFKINILLKDGNYYAEIPIKDGFVHFEFSEFEFTAYNKECVIKCWVETPGGRQDEFEQRINILSTNAKNDFVKQLKESFGKETNWTLIFSNVCSKVSRALEEKQVARSYSDFELKPESDLLAPFLRDQAVNVIFGMGGSGKTWLALEMGLCVAFGIPFLGFKPQSTGNVLFLDYEDSHNEFFNRISLLAGNKNITVAELNERLFRLDAEGLPLKDRRNIIKKEIINKKIKLLIVDAAADACGGEPESAAIASSFFNVLTSLNICVLLIAHKTKADEGDKYPFGSIFFYNRPRNIWYVKKDEEEGEDMLHLGLIHKKCNYAKKSQPYGLKIDITKELVTISTESNKRWGEDLGTKSRIINSLEESPKTLTELSKELNILKDRIKPRLSELAKQGKIKASEYGGKWEIIDPIQIGL